RGSGAKSYWNGVITPREEPSDAQSYARSFETSVHRLPVLHVGGVRAATHGVYAVRRGARRKKRSTDVTTVELHHPTNQPHHSWNKRACVHGPRLRARLSGHFV